MHRPGLRTGHIVSLAGAGAVLVALWLPWYSVRLPDVLNRLGAVAPPSLKGFTDQLAAALPPDVHATAWEIFGGADVAIAACALVVGAVLLATGGALGPSVKVEGPTAGRLATWIGAAIALIAGYKLVHPPGDASFVHPLTGPWIALAGALMIAAGGWAAAADPR